MEVRQIPVLSEDTPNVLDPGWTDQYREERGKLLEECAQEMEMKELAGVASDRKLSEWLVIGAGAVSPSLGNPNKRWGHVICISIKCMGGPRVCAHVLAPQSPSK